MWIRMNRPGVDRDRSEIPVLWYVVGRVLPEVPTEQLEGILATLNPGGSLIAAKIKRELELRG